MAIKDKIKWDKKYQETPKLLEQREPSSKLISILPKVKGTQALDIACGAGKNSIYLAKQGFNVDAMDISKIALEHIENQKMSGITTHVVDLEGFSPQANHYDLIVKTNYLDRDIIPALITALKKDGVLFIETYMNHAQNEKPPSNPAFLLNQEELKSFFDESMEIIEYDEFFNEPDELYIMRKQAIAVKKH